MAETKYERTIRLAELALEFLGAANGKAILGWVKQNCEPHDTDGIETVWGTYLSRAVDDPNTRIKREPGRYRYLLEKRDKAEVSYIGDADEPPLPPDPDVDSALANQSTDQVKVQRERKLYSLLVEWLSSKDFAAEDTSAGRSGGVWGNPDVVGIKCFDGFGGIPHIELVSIEAKVSSKDWRRLFFEAVAHKRFADRAYFAYAFGSDEVILSKVPDFQEQRAYAEKYGVGVLVIFMETDLFDALTRGGADESLEDLSLESVRVEEIWPAPYDAVSAVAREAFIRDVLGISGLMDLIRFGD